MDTRIAVNGFGRIGRDVLRVATDRAENGLRTVAVNDVTSPQTLAHLLRYDSTYGTWRREITADDESITVDGERIRVFREADPTKLPWEELGVDIVIESTGRFRTRDAAAAHLVAGARKVVITAPGKDVDATIVLGVNDETYRPESHHVVSNASCTTNCLAPMVHVLHRRFGVYRGLMTTIHSYTNDQSLLDGPHKDLRRARSAAVNMIPTSTGAATAVGLVLPELRGRLHGVAVRVPVEDASLTDLTVNLARPATAAEINRAFAEAADGPLKAILRYTEDPVVSRDIIGDPASCVIDGQLTIADEGMAKVFGWYDNEWGYANRTLDLVHLMAGTL
jgi:glyceraldehyde 3-phosphate dehydrogenase